MLTRVTYTATAGQQNFAVPFEYLLKAHVKVYINGVPQTVISDYTWLNQQTIRFGGGLTEGAQVRIKRDTPIDARLVTFHDGSFLNEGHMNTDSNQTFYLLQELLDRSYDTDPEFYDPDALRDILWGWLDYNWFVEELRKPLWHLHEIWGWDALFEPDIFEGDVFQNVLEALPGRINGAEIRIDDAESNITLQAGLIDELEGVINNTQIELDGLEATIELKADQVTVDDLLVRMSGAELRLDGAEAEIQLNVMEIENLDGEITYQAGQMALLTDQWYVKLDVNGYVTGLGLYNEGDTSGFVVMTDKFGIIAPGGEGTPKAPFVVDTTTGLVGIDGSLLVTGTVGADKVVIGDIDIEDLMNFDKLSYAYGNESSVFWQEKQDAIINGKSIIIGGYINTELIEAESIAATKIAVGGIDIYDLENALDLYNTKQLSEQLQTEKLDAVINGKTLITNGYINTNFLEANSITGSKMQLGSINCLELNNAPAQAGADKTSLNTAYNTLRVGGKTASEVNNSLDSSWNWLDHLQTEYNNARLNGYTVIENGYLRTDLINVGTITADKISARAISTDKLAIGGVATTNIASNAVSSLRHWNYGGYYEVARHTVYPKWFSASNPSQHDIRTVSFTSSTGGNVSIEVSFTCFTVWESVDYDYLYFRVQRISSGSRYTVSEIKPFYGYRKWLKPSGTWELQGNIDKVTFILKDAIPAGGIQYILQGGQFQGVQGDTVVFDVSFRVTELKR